MSRPARVAEPTKRKDLRKRLMAGIIVAAASVASAELLSFAALWWSEGRPFASGALQAERTRLIAEAAERSPPGSQGAGAPREAQTEAAASQAPPAKEWQNLLDDPAHARRALHPYLGYVYDPAVNASAARRQSGYPAISGQGFYVVPNPAGGEPRLTVAVFGGSMAMLMALEGRDALARELEAARALHGRKVSIRCYALGGYKQPQQLLALAYLLSLGERPDLIINLDGLNEVALPYAENRPRGVSPFYPRSWDALVQDVANPAALEEAGLAAYFRARRVSLAQLFSARLLRHSATANLLWRSLDRRLERNTGEANVALARIPSGGAGFAATGPRQDYASEDEFFAGLAGAWRTSSLLMSRLAADSGIRYYHFLQPNQFDPGAKPIGRVEAARAVDPASPFQEPVRRGYPLLSLGGQELRRAGVRFFDLRQVFSRVETPLYIDKCCHVSREGSALLAAAIGRAVRQDLDGQPPTGSSH